MNASEFKAAAAERGLDWHSVRALYDSMRAEDSAQHDRQLAFLRAAYKGLFGSEHGGHFKARRRAEFAGGDHATIPGFDIVADTLAGEFPEFLARDSAAADLWAALIEPAPEPPAAADTMRRALERAENECAPVPGSPRDMVSTRDAAAAANVSEQWIRKLVSTGKIPGFRVGKSYMVSLSAAQKFQRHPTAGRPRGSIVQPDGVPF